MRDPDGNPRDPNAIRMTESEQLEMMSDYASVAEDAKYPPFTVPANTKDEDFLLILSREYDHFVYGEKPYDSFRAVQEAYSDELVESRAWRSLAYSPQEAAMEVIVRSLRDASVPAEEIKYYAERDYVRTAKTQYMGDVQFLPWEPL